MTELAVLQAVRLKGRVTTADLAATLDEDLDDVTKAAEQLTESGLLVGGATLRISPSGRDRLDALLAAERKGIDAAAMTAAYDEVHARALPIIEAAAAQLPRLNSYSTKLIAALGKIKAGDSAWLARPLIDSYHTVWFEWHEELIVAAGLTREEAARSDDAH
jgi:hypothetical protein